MPRHRDAPLPAGTVTFLFTDIEGSTELLARQGDRYAELQGQHARLLRIAIDEHGGSEVGTEGDAFFAAFPSAPGAVRAAVHAQRALAHHPWPKDGVIRVRMGLHTGEGRLGGDDYVGLDVHRAARIAAAGHGGQLLLSEATRALVASSLPDGVALRDLGEHRLKDLPAPERIWQLDIDRLEGDFPPIRSLGGRPHGMPLEPSPLIGREVQLARAIELLQQRRLLTLTGPGGAGKTRLAVALADRLAVQHAEGAWFVALQDAGDRAAVVAAIARALGIRERPDRDLEASLKAQLGDREQLIVLDNFEQVLSASPLVSELLAIAPRLRVIVTSRAVLHVAGEQEYEVPPLGLPDPHGLPSLDALSQYESVRLFIERAREARPDFEVTNENAPAVAEICSRLDGLPLAIELAAARVKLITPQAILDRLQRSLPVLASGDRDVPARQRTLHGAIDWSYRLLDEPERRLFERLAVFAGGWTIEAAEQVSLPDSGAGIEAFDGLAGLVDKSLIQPLEGEAGEDRFRMLQVIREFALEKLDADPDGREVRRRHAHHVRDLAEVAEPELERAEVRRWQRRLRSDEDNIRVALRWAIDQGDAETGLRTAGALWRFWHYWGRLREGIGWLEQLLALPAAARPYGARAKGLTALAGLVYWLGEAERAESLYLEVLAIHEQSGDRRRSAETLLSAAYTAIGRDDVPVALQRAASALERYREAGDHDGEIVVSAWLRAGAYLAGAGGSAEDAIEAAQDVIRVSRERGRALDEADAVGTLASVYQLSGDYPRAMDAFRRVARAWVEMGNVGMLPWARMGAALELHLGRPRRAAVLAAVAARSVEEIGGMLPESLMGTGDPAAEARERMGEAEYAMAVEEGRAMTFEAAGAYMAEEESEAAVRP